MTRRTSLATQGGILFLILCTAMGDETDCRYSSSSSPCLSNATSSTIDHPYLGAKTTAQKRALNWLARTSATASLLGASYILWDVLRQHHHYNNSITVYHELVCGMAIFDMITALAWMAANAAVPEASSSSLWEYEQVHVQGAMGNTATCRAQAFWIQLGFGSVLYNVSLTVYYVLVVVRGWRADDLRAIRWYLHGLPVGVAAVLAVGILPFAEWMGYACHLGRDYYSEEDYYNYWRLYVFVVIPIGAPIVVITAGMLYMYADVRHKSRASRKWRFGVGSPQNSLETQVFWRAVFYTMSFYVTWPLVIVAYTGTIDYWNVFGLSAAIAVAAPLSGWTNGLVYARPRLLEQWKNRRGGRSNNSNSNDNNPRKVEPSVAIELSHANTHSTVESSLDVLSEQPGRNTEDAATAVPYPLE